jgi:hypothetical protein
MRALTGSEVLVANKLFATLDTTVRALHPESVPRVLVSDTVGFIKNLPHGLVASFKSTLDEALDASLLLHVIDASDPGFERQLEVTDKVLAEIGADVCRACASSTRSTTSAMPPRRPNAKPRLRAQYPDCIVMSARRPDEVARLRQTIVAFFQQDLVEAELFLPWSAQQLRGDIYANCEVLEERADGEGAFFRLLRDRLDPTCSQLGALPGLRNITSIGHRDAHAPFFEGFRLAKQTQIATRDAQGLSDAFKGNAVIFHAAVDDGRGAWLAQVGIDRQAKDGAGMKFKFRETLRAERDQTGIVRAGADFGKPDHVALDEQLNTENATSAKVAGDGSGDLLGFFQCAGRHGLRLPGFDVVAGHLNVADGFAEVGLHDAAFHRAPGR